jgi:hypothetical protein
MDGVAGCASRRPFLQAILLAKGELEELVAVKV